MSEFLLLSVYRRYLENEGYTLDQKAAIPGGVVDILAKSTQRILLAEAKWIRSPGDIYEAIGRCVQNKLAVPEGTPVLVLPIGVLTEEIRERILGACYKHGIELHFVDINKREVFPDYLTAQIYPGLQGLVRNALMVQEQKLSGPQATVLRTLITPLHMIQHPPELIDDINQVLSRL
jgi:hypothetical protein